MSFIQTYQQKYHNGHVMYLGIGANSNKNETNGGSLPPMANASNCTDGAPQHYWCQWLSPSVIAIGHCRCHLNGDNGAIKWRSHGQDYHQKEGSSPTIGYNGTIFPLKWYQCWPMAPMVMGCTIGAIISMTVGDNGKPSIPLFVARCSILPKSLTERLDA